MMSDDVPEDVEAYEAGRRVAFAQAAEIVETMAQAAQEPGYAPGLGRATGAVAALFLSVSGHFRDLADLKPEADDPEAEDEDEEGLGYDCGWYDAFVKAAEAVALGSAKVMTADNSGLSVEQRVAVQDSLRAFAELFLRLAGTDPLGWRAADDE